MNTSKKYTVRRDCFAGGTGKCTLLLEELCRTGPCPFFRTKLQAQAARDRAYWAALGKGYYASGDYAPKHCGDGIHPCGMK